MLEEKTSSITFIGECMVEITGDVNNYVCQGFAGDTLNTAVYLSRLFPSNQLPIHYMTALGIDPLSNSMLDYFKEEGIQCEKIRRIPDRQPGLYCINVDSNGERSFQYWRDQSAARYLLSGHEFDTQLESLANINYIYLSGISLAILPEPDRQKLLDSLARAKKQGAKICFDNNYRYQLWSNSDEAQQWYRKILLLTDIAFLTYDDECELWDDASPDQIFDRNRHFGIAEVVLKRGAKSCLIETSTKRYSVNALEVPPERIVDTTAAGDSFSAGYLANRLKGAMLPPKCAELGHRLASTVIQHPGAIISRELVAGVNQKMSDVTSDKAHTMV